MIRVYTPIEARRVQQAAAQISNLGGTTRKASGVRRIHHEGMPCAAKFSLQGGAVGQSAVYRFPGNVHRDGLLDELREMRGLGREEFAPHIESAESALVVASAAAEMLLTAGSMAIRGRQVRVISSATDGKVTFRLAPGQLGKNPGPSRWEHAVAGLYHNLGLDPRDSRTLLPAIHEQVEVTFVRKRPTTRRSPMGLLPEKSHKTAPRLFLRRDWIGIDVTLVAPRTDPELWATRLGIMAAGLEFLAMKTDVRLTF